MNLNARSRFVMGTIAAMCIGASADMVRGADTSVPPVTIHSGQAQLFVDDYLIATQAGLQRTLRQPDEGRRRQ